MKPELIDVVRQLKEIREAQDVYLLKVPSDIRNSVFDNKYIDLLEAKVQILTDIVFKGSEEDIYWFLYEFHSGRTEGPHIVDKTGKEWFIRSNADYYEYLKGV
jgi:hypothetical protein